MSNAGFDSPKWLRYLEAKFILGWILLNFTEEGKRSYKQGLRVPSGYTPTSTWKTHYSETVSNVRLLVRMITNFYTFIHHIKYLEKIINRGKRKGKKNTRRHVVTTHKIRFDEQIAIILFFFVILLVFSLFHSSFLPNG